MVWTPKSMDERTEAGIMAVGRSIVDTLGQEKASEVLDLFLLQQKDELLANAEEDNPALIRLKKLLAKQERGFE
jgi:hypothetical protein